MKKNPLSVWTFSYRKSYYLTHPHKFLKDLYWNVRNFWHRGRYGYAYVDVWNLGEWAPKVIAEALRYLAAHHCAYPGKVPYETPEKWKEHLEYLANQFQRCADFQDVCITDERNEYKEEYEEMMNRVYEESTKDGMVYAGFKLTDEDKKLRDKYFARCKELAEVEARYAREVFAKFGENLNIFWD